MLEFLTRSACKVTDRSKEDIENILAFLQAHGIVSLAEWYNINSEMRNIVSLSLAIAS